MELSTKIMELWTLFWSYFWSPTFWFPDNLSWDAFRNTDDGVYRSQAKDLLYVLPIALVLVVLRKLFEMFVGVPIGRYFGLKERSTLTSKKNPVLEKAFSINNTPEHQDILGLSKKTGLTVRQVERWYRHKRNSNKTSELSKFSETSWKFTFYFSVFFAGLYILWDKPWFTSTFVCWKDFSNHHVPTDVFWWYLIEMGFYVSLMCSQFFDVKRKDFYEMMIHHLATLSLMFLSWCSNFVRMGTLVLCVHDANDYLLEFSKLMVYIKYHKAVNVTFIIFVLSWIATRLIIYPVWILNSTLFEAVEILGMCNIYYLYNGCLLLLQVLHIIWFYFIMRGLFKVLLAGGITKDTRSESEDTDSDGETEPQQAN